ncbi:hypothetical protein [Plebeiibacterium sediminum]|uniref:Uncharacterized protein n=1 Tax=Plebeiibacterium sediminum TaxID=2992112 RepID=A0AAE3M9E7_9BACT|nr:hypothetical protein [Plebeiobacterium sediminum]MCW3789701.1 hypothetical protein [Plebeiobacterium sediminum]
MGIDERLIEWINKTGYPLEIFTESVLSKYDYKIINSEIYQDKENNISRELDLFASKSWDIEDFKVNLDIHLLIECKKSTKPFLLLKNNSIKEEKLSLGEIYGSNDLLSMIFLTGSPTEIDVPGKFESGFKLIQAFNTSDETIHKAVNTLLKSFNHFISKEKEYEDDYKTDNVHSIVLPILIIDAPFYALGLNKDSELEINEIETGILKHRSHLNRFENDTFPITIITKNKVEDFAKSINIFGELFFKYLVENPDYNINNLQNLEIKVRNNA